MITADLKGKKALVTGAASGIGLATAELLARMGAKVAINDLARSERLPKEVERLRSTGVDVIAAPGDVGDAKDAARMVETAAAAMGGLDYLVNNAGTPGTDRPIPPSDLERQDEAFWQKLLSVNLIGPFRCVRAAAPHLKKSRGAIVNTASISAFGRGGSSSVYCMTKAGLVSMTKELARGLAPEVRVNAIAPGLVQGSNWQCRWTEDEVDSDVANIPLQRPGKIE
ncbi:MAG: SDR family NAD(P)-dependent oxidoreductase, partial [Dongiaceae bacterium]